VDLIATIGEECLNGVGQLIRQPFVIIRGIVLLVVTVVLNVDSITAIVNEVANHCLTCEVACKTFMDCLDLFAILKGDSHVTVLGGSVHAESTGRSTLGMCVLMAGMIMAKPLSTARIVFFAGWQSGRALALQRKVA
jgi:hypothetical protein